jgi:hypothetical protein
MEIKFVKSERMEPVGGVGLALVGQILKRYTNSPAGRALGAHSERPIRRSEPG